MGSLAKWTNARVLAIDYRLAPQNPFPAALQDALAAYLYLLNPPKDTGFEPLNPKNIVIAGDSAGGGLSLALGLAIRDAGLPSCAGISCWSPWVDLTHGTPSILDDECVDFIPKFKGNFHIFPQYLMWISMWILNGKKFLMNLPPLLLVAGDEERIRDEIIYLAHRSAEPTKYKGPSYNAGKFEKSPFQTPTNTTLEIYEEVTHVFQTLEHPSTTKSYERTSEFINRVINSPNEPLPPSSYNCINVKGEFNHLKEHHKKVLNWKEIGIVPSITRNEFNSTSHRLTPKLLISIADLRSSNFSLFSLKYIMSYGILYVNYLND
ncbi:unnamed protein product [Rhizophagus irregularis]|nr:unnamed protein product [Rhizophagus irregularis]